MHLLVHSLFTRARTVLGQWGTGHEGNGPAGNDTKGQSVQIPGNAVIQESMEPDFTSVSPVSSENPDTAIPITGSASGSLAMASEIAPEAYASLKRVADEGRVKLLDLGVSRNADGLWFNTNVGEAIPDVITPLSWSIVMR